MMFLSLSYLSIFGTTGIPYPCADRTKMPSSAEQAAAIQELMQSVAKAGLDSSLDIHEELAQILSLASCQGSNPVQDSIAALCKGGFTAHICLELLSMIEDFPMKMLKCIVKDKKPTDLKVSQEAYDAHDGIAFLFKKLKENRAFSRERAFMMTYKAGGSFSPFGAELHEKGSDFHEHQHHQRSGGNLSDIVRRCYIKGEHVDVMATTGCQRLSKHQGSRGSSKAGSGQGEGCRSIPILMHADLVGPFNKATCYDSVMPFEGMDQKEYVSSFATAAKKIFKGDTGAFDILLGMMNERVTFPGLTKASKVLSQQRR